MGPENLDPLPSAHATTSGGDELGSVVARLVEGADRTIAIIAQSGSGDRFEFQPDAVGPIDVASVTKLFTALAVAVAVEERSVAYEDVIDPERGVTLADALAHAGGYAANEGAPLAPPRTRRIYSNQGFERVGEYLHQRTGIPVESYIAEAVLAPLGMTSSKVGTSAAFGAISSVVDLATLGKEMLAPRLIHPSTWTRMTSVYLDGLDGVLPGFGPQRPNPWGLGVEIRGTKTPHWAGLTAGTDAFGHFGRSGSYLLVAPAHDLTIALTSAVEFDAWDHRHWGELNDAIIAAMTA